MNLLTRIFLRRRLERDASDEIRGHLEERTHELLEAGLGRDEARRRARREFGNTARIEEEAREVWRWGWIEDCFSDTRVAFRQLKKSPGFAVAGALTLAVGVGANTAVFSVVNAVLLRPLPFSQPERLVSVVPRNDAGPAGDYSVSYPTFFDMRRENTAFEELASYRTDRISLTGSGESAQLRVAIVSANLFTMLGRQPVLGRGFQPGEEEPDARVTVISHALWTTRFGADPGIVGRTIDLDREPFSIVGVAPEGFNFPLDGARVQIWVPLAVDARSATLQPVTRQRGARMLTVVGRLRNGVTIEQAQAQMDGIARSLAARYPNENRRYPGVQLQPAGQRLTGSFRDPLVFLFGAVALVLVLACANIVNLLLSRTAERSREFALRSAIGAARSRLVRQVIGESAVLCVLGCAGGVATAVCLLRLVIPLAGSAIPRIQEAAIDSRVLGFSLAMTAAAAILFGLVPLTRLRRGDVSGALQEAGRTHMHGSDRLRNALVVLQVAIGLTLASGAGLLTASYLHLTLRDPGFEPARLLTFNVSLPSAEYSGARRLEFYERLIERIEGLPGASSAAAGMPLPLTGVSMRIAFDIEQRPAPPPERPTSNMAIVTPGFFETAGIPLLAGRYFSATDDANSPPVLIVNRAFADRFFPGEEAIGKRIRPGATSDARGPLMREIVGIVGDARQSPLGAQADTIYYFPHRQLQWCCPAVIMRAAGAPRALEASIRAVLASMDRQLPMADVRTGADLLALGVTAPRFLMALVASFAAIGLLLTAVGLYGVLNYAVVKQTREIGVRMALGASRSRVVSMVLRKAIALVVAGTGIGAAASIAGSRVMQSMMHGVEGRTPALLAVATGVILGAALLAVYLPARRAASIDPTIALRHD